MSQISNFGGSVCVWEGVLHFYYTVKYDMAWHDIIAAGDEMQH